MRRSMKGVTTLLAGFAMAVVLAACASAGPMDGVDGSPAAGSATELPGPSATPRPTVVVPEELRGIFPGDPPNHGSQLVATDPADIRIGNGLTPQLVEVFSYS